MCNFSQHPFFNAENSSAEKVCLSDGTWWRHPLTNITFSNYNPCVPVDRFSEHMTTLNTVGISLSLVLLVVSLLIFTMFSSSLNCGRVSMHRNLFLACSFRKAFTKKIKPKINESITIGSNYK